MREREGRVDWRAHRFVRVRVDLAGGGHIALGDWPPSVVVRRLEAALAVQDGEPCRLVVPGLDVGRDAEAEPGEVQP